METILLIDDDEQLILLLKAYLKNIGYNVIIASDGKEGIDLLKENHEIISIIIIDMAMPVIDGIEACRIIREKLYYTEMPILMLTSMSAIEDKYLGFNAGVDDYLVKPFEPLELSMRIKSLSRRKNNHKSENKIENNKSSQILKIDPESNSVILRGQEVYLSRLEFNLLNYLHQNTNRAISTEEILEKVFDNANYIGSSDTVRTHIRNLRIKLEEDPANPKIITNLFKRGYILKTDI